MRNCESLLPVADVGLLRPTRGWTAAATRVDARGFKGRTAGGGFRRGSKPHPIYQLGVLQALLTVTDRLTVFLSLQILQMTSPRSFFSEGRIHGPPRLLPKSSKIEQTPV